MVTPIPAQPSEVEAHGIPVDFLNAYPFPAFALRISVTGSAGGASTAGVGAALGEIRRGSGASLESAEQGRTGPSSALANDITDTLRSSTLPVFPPKCSFNASTPSESETSTTTTTATNDVTGSNWTLDPTTPMPHVPTAQHPARPSPSLGGHLGYDFVHAPMPEYAPPLLVCANEAWTKLSGGCYFRDIVEPHALVAFESWVRSDSTKEPTFTMSLARRKKNLELVKTRHMIPPTARCYGHCPFSFVILTSVQVNEVQPAMTPLPRQQPLTTKNLLKHGPTMPMATDVHASFQREQRLRAAATLDSDDPPTPRAGSAARAAAYKPPADDIAAAHKRRPPSPSSSFNDGDRSDAVNNIPTRMQTVDQYKELFNGIDWSKTTIGPVESWPPEVITMMNVMFESYYQDSIWIGEEFVMVYNQNYGRMLANPGSEGRPAHPGAFGRPAAKVWLSIWKQLAPLAERCMSGETIYSEDQVFFYLRDGRPRARYHTVAMIPIRPNRDPSARALGMYVSAYDTTNEVQAARRMVTSNLIVERLLSVTSTVECCHIVAGVVEENPVDLPFAIIYSVQAGEVSPSTLTAGETVKVELNLASTVGVPDQSAHVKPKMSLTVPYGPAHGLRPPSLRATGDTIDRAERVSDWLSSPTPSVASSHHTVDRRQIITSVDSAAWPIHKALTTGKIVVCACSQLISDFKIRCWEELPYQAVVVPILPEATADSPARAVMIFGLNSRRPLDNDYEDWLQVLRGHVTVSLASVHAFQMQVHRRLESEQLDRAKSMWLRNAALQLRSPMTLIQGPLDELGMTKLSQSQKHTLNVAQKNVYRLRQLVTSLLFFGKLETGSVQPQMVPANLGALVESVAGLFRQAADRLSVTLDLEVDAYKGSTFLDPVLIEMVLSNLLGTAIQSSRKSTITIKVHYEPDFADILIRTTTVIPEGQFGTEVDLTPHASSRGHGLAFALAAKLLRLHEGQLIVRSASDDAGVDRGTLIIARLPHPHHLDDVIPIIATPGTYGRDMAQDLVPVSMSQDDDEGSSQRSGRSGRSGEQSYNGAESLLNTDGSSFSGQLGFKETDQILVVDDDADIRLYLMRLFEPLCKVVEAESPQEALEMAHEKPPDLILIDMFSTQMPTDRFMLGIRSNPVTRSVPVIILAGAPDDGEAQLAALQAGADGFLSKPFKPKELILRASLQMQVGKKRVKLESLFAEREQELKVLSDYCPSGILRTGANGQVIYANEVLREMGGMPLEEEIVDWTDYVDEETGSRIRPLWADTVTGSRTTTHAEWKWRNGRIMSGVFIKLDQLRPGMSGIVGCVTDITYQEEKLLEAERRRIEAEESKHQQELLVDLTSHEIRTPVSAILHCSSVVLENLVALKNQLHKVGASGGGFYPTPDLLGELEEDIVALESIHQCGLYQERIAGDVLSLARIQLDMLSLVEIDVDLRNEANKVLTVFSSEARLKKIDIRLVFGDTVAAMGVDIVHMDPVRLGQIVTNLVTNAIRYTTFAEVRQIVVTFNTAWVPPIPGTCDMPILSSDAPTGKVPDGTSIYLYVSVHDTGPGMSGSDQINLFKPFRQGKVKIHTRYGGSGLGLFICKKITELYDGDIEVQSEEGAGSTFQFYAKIRTALALPGSLKEVDNNHRNSPMPDANDRTRQNAVVLDNPAVSPSALTPRHAPPISSFVTAPEGMPSTLHVLVVDDNIINQTVLKRQFKKAGLTCLTADNGQEALNRIYESQATNSEHPDSTQFDVVLMDIEMPIMDGLTAVRQVRVDEAMGRIRPQIVIALTGNARPGQIEKAREAGMDDVITKPYRLPDLLTKMREAVQARRNRGEAIEAPYIPKTSPFMPVL